MSKPLEDSGATVSVTVSPTGEAFACAPGETVLMAGLKAGLNLPYECVSGACGSCRCKLLSGKVESLWAAAPGLSDRDRRRGDVVLMCQSRPSSDIAIAVPLREPTDVPRPLATPARIVAVRCLTADMVMLTLEPEARLCFLPGQFVMIDLPAVGRRAYSMANVDRGQNRLDLIVKAKPDGAVSHDLCRRSGIGDRIDIEGPYGGAYYRSDRERPVVGIAGGSGLAPIWSIAQAAASERERDVHLYFGVNTPADGCFVDEFAALAKSNRRVKTHQIVREPADTSSRGGLVGDVVVEDLPDLRHADVYMAGPPAMIDALLQRFVSEGRVDCDHVFFDRFA